MTSIQSPKNTMGIAGGWFSLAAAVFVAAALAQAFGGEEGRALAARGMSFTPPEGYRLDGDSPDAVSPAPFAVFKADPVDGFACNFSFLAAQLPTPVTSEGIAAEVQAGFGALPGVEAKLVPLPADVYPGGGWRAACIEAEGDFGAPVRMHILQYVFMRGHETITATFTSTADHFAESGPPARRALDGVRFAEPDRESQALAARGMSFAPPEGFRLDRDSPEAVLPSPFALFKADPVDGFADNFNFLDLNLPRPATVQEIAAGALVEYGARKNVEAKAIPLPDGDFPGGGWQAACVEAEGDFGVPIRIKVLQYIFFRGEKAITATFTTTAGRFDETGPAALRAFEGVRFNND